MSTENLTDLRTLLSKPPEGWCWCVAWETPTWDGWADRSAEENRLVRESLWARGEFHGYVFYLDNIPVGWCRVGPTRIWPKLCRERGIQPSDTEHVFTCFGIRPEYRSQGHLHTFFAAVLNSLRERGVTRVLAVPKNFTERQSDGHIWNGPVSLFTRAGFSPFRDAEQYSVFVLDL